ncbi:MAG: formate dehydrogenase subunit gamma [Kiloniellaceae bacterium]
MTASDLRLRRNAFSRLFGLLLLSAFLAAAGGPIAPGWAQSDDRTAAEAPVGGNVPGNVLGNQADSEFWRAIRQGERGSVSIPNSQAGQMIQSEGDNWRAVRNGPVTVYGAWTMLGVVAILALFFVVRGRIRIDAGPSGTTIQRFNMVERTAHWITASSFVILALTGLNILYGRHVLLPILGLEVFSAITTAGKYAHNFLAFAFMLGVVMIFLLWVRHNLPSRTDLKWLAVGGGMFKKGVHPPAKKFNAGQKFIFWAVVLGGISISLSGLALLFPFQFAFFAKTFQVINVFGFGLPENLTMLQEMQLSQLWHSIVALILIAIIIGHIYIGSLGMEGAFEAMGSGDVDLNWAKEHHGLWVDEVREKGAASQQPAE